MAAVDAGRNRSSSWLSAAAIVLAAFQLTRWLTVERGPFRVLERIRERLGRLTTAVQCPFCLGFWFTLAAVLLWRVPGARFLVKVLALVGVQTLLQQASQRLDTYGTTEVSQPPIDEEAIARKIRAALIADRDEVLSGGIKPRRVKYNPAWFRFPF
jgi:hypothetical protein